VRYFGEDGYVAIGIEASDRSADSAFGRSLLQEEIEVVFPIDSRWTLRLNGSVGEEDFDDQSSNPVNSKGPVRNDRTWSASAALACDLNDRLRLLVRGGYQTRDSNVSFTDGLPALDYRRTILETGLSWAF
jgi:hypothetical protein